ncbi:MAG: MBL fold metallo-hydrolase [Bacteroidetes bacterium]|nr:MBL fold metallo-hydrolase [Bacteroidota bacterium]
MKQFGQNPTGEHKSRINKSVNFKNGIFNNLIPTQMIPKDVSVVDMMKDYINTPHERIPQHEIPSVKTNLYELHQTKPVVTWFGHSSYHLFADGKHILVDPVFSGHASPFPFMIKAFKGTDIYGVNDFLKIDVLILTHDHYDHLDYKTLIQLKSKTVQVVCSLGVAAHLVHWGFDKKSITELDWWDAVEVNTIKITAAPARHFSGRLIKRAQTLWSSFVLQTKEHQIFLGGDSGYGEHFAEIGKRFGGFDLAILECGQYNTKWPMIHMSPEETVQANTDLRSKMLLPVHWGKFALAFHSWNEPVNRVVGRAKQLNIDYTVPKIGERIVVGDKGKVEEWWK